MRKYLVSYTGSMCLDVHEDAIPDEAVCGGEALWCFMPASALSSRRVIELDVLNSSSDGEIAGARPQRSKPGSV